MISGHMLHDGVVDMGNMDIMDNMTIMGNMIIIVNVGPDKIDI